MQLYSKELILPLKNTFRISRNSLTEKEIIIIKIQGDSELFGYGEVTIYPYYGQTKDLARRSLKRIAQLLKRMKPPQSNEDEERIMKAIRRELSGPDRFEKKFNNVFNALDCALLDLSGRTKGIALADSLYREFFSHSEGTLETLPLTSYTIGIDAPEIIKERLEEAFSKKILKVKLGSSYSENVNILKTVRSLTDRPLRIDANCAWNLKVAEKMVSFLADKNVEFIEQPLPPIGESGTGIEDFARLKLQGQVPIFLDESIVCFEDIKTHAILADGINLKLPKCGGPRECIRMIEEAQKHDLKVMIGCMIETSIAFNFEACLAPAADCVDLDGSLLLKNDPYRDSGNFKIEPDGRIVRTESLPGIGIIDKNSFTSL